jgi:Holliday junction resolvasome RuvABC endonuclease subunit
MTKECIDHKDLPLVVACGMIDMGSQSVARFLRLDSEIKALFNRFKPELIIVEGNFVYKNIKTTCVLNQLLGAVRLLAALNGIDVSFMDNNSSKSKMLGSTKFWDGEKYVGVTKDMMEAAVGTSICEHSAKPADDNAADAIAIGFAHFDTKTTPVPLPKRPLVAKPRIRRTLK